MELSDTERAFILHWGEMGSRWGINRVMAQVHALLLVAPRALHAQEICEALEISRSNVSTALRELQSWGIVKLVHVLGDRREHFDADKDAWNVLAKIAEKRLDQEIAPTIALLRELSDKKHETRADLKRLFTDFTDVLESGARLFRRLRALPPTVVRRFFLAENTLEKFLKKVH